MRRVWRMGYGAAALAVSILAGHGGTMAQDSCPNGCAKADKEKTKKRSCFSPEAAPEAAVAFAVPAVMTRGQAVRVPESAVNQALKKAAAEAAKAVPESTAVEDKTGERLDNLERDVRELRGMLEKLTLVLTSLEDKLDEPAK